MEKLTEREAFESRVEKSEEGCWEWRGFRNRDGYGVFTFKGKQRFAHRAAYELYVSPIPEGLAVDHCCCNRGCVNPAHLEAVSWSENSRRKGERNTHCSRGHPYDEENTYVNPNTGIRYCRACKKLDYKRHRAKHEHERPDFRRLDRECKNGHPRTPENTYVYPKSGNRTCKLCLQAKYLKAGGYKDPKRKRGTHCPKGHEYTPKNTYTTPKGYRYCRECNRAAAR